MLPRLGKEKIFFFCFLADFQRVFSQAFMTILQILINSWAQKYIIKKGNLFKSNKSGVFKSF